MNGFVISGTHSGVGKTSVSLGIMGALARRGLAVAPFKVGPDYIDPTYHTLVTGRPSRNLDTWLMPAGEMAAVFHRGVASAAAAGRGSLPAAGAGRPAAPVAVVEGVMGLFDGLAGGGERCSTAEVAKLLGLPVFLVVDTSSMARSVAALVHGFRTFDPALRLAGVVLNKVASPSHEAMVREALAGGPPIVGALPREADLHLGSRHLGLFLAGEHPATRETLQRIVAHVERHVDLDSLLERAHVAAGDRAGAQRAQEAGGGSGGHDEGDTAGLHTGVLAGGAPKSEPPRGPRVAVARDAAFAFYYEDNLEALREEGAQVVEFSPLAGEGLPSCDGVYLGGGYPELYGEQLAANDGLRRDLREAFAAGVRIYAECGGYLYLGREVEYEGRRHGMAGLLPTRASLGGGRLRMGYVEARARDAHPLAERRFRGHLFHYSTTEVVEGGALRPAYDVRRKDEALTDGLAGRGLVASYVHLHFRGSRPLARWLALGEGEQGGTHGS